VSRDDNSAISGRWHKGTVVAAQAPTLRRIRDLRRGWICYIYIFETV
jgi:hypothetical protein